MKKTMALAAVLLFVLCGQTARAADAPNVSAKAAVVYHGDTDRILYEKNGHSPMLIASTTKIMTALVALETCDLQDEVTVTAEMAEVEGSSMYLRCGECYTVEELLYGLMLASGNDAATAIAIHAAGSPREFAALMNAKAQSLGLTNTHFDNPHGLDSETHYSTAADMARLMAKAMENSTFARIAGTATKSVKGLTYVNHNKLLWQCEGVIGGKTGYTMAAGRTLVTCCERDGQRLVCVTLSDPDDWTDHKSLYDWAYSAYKNRVLIPKDTRYLVPVVSAEGKKLAAEPLTDVTAFAAADDAADYRIELPRFVFGPVYAGDRLGSAVVYLEGKRIGEVALVSMETYSVDNTNDSPVSLKRLLQRLRGG